MTLTNEKFVQLLTVMGVSPSVAKNTAEPLRAAMALYDISTPEVIAGFLGQVLVESVNLTHLEENLNYITEGALVRAYGKRMVGRKDLLRNPKGLAIAAYGGRLGNAKAPSTDGWDFRGSGFIQTTGRTNFTNLAKGANIDVVKNPSLLRTDMSIAAIAACYYFTSAKVHAPAKACDWDKCTRLVNGPGMLEKEKRASLSNKVLRELKKLA